MSIQLIEHSQTAEIRIAGKFLGALHGEAFNDLFNQVKAKKLTNVVINLSNTDMIDSTGIGLFISALTSLRRENGDIRLAGMHTRIKNVFLMTRLLGPVFKNYETLDEALESFTSAAEV